MKKLKSIQFVSILLFGIAISSILIKIYNGYFQTETFENGVSFKVNYNFEFKNEKKDGSYFIKAFLAQSDFRQKISNENHQHSSSTFEQTQQGINTIGLWNGKSANEKEKISYTFDALIKPIRYDISNDIKYKSITNKYSEFVQPSPFIESRDPRISKLANKLLGYNTRADDVLNALFGYVYEIPSQSIKELMTATEALEINAASCNGKSRLLVALCRNLNIPARVVGGIILTEEKKKTSHLWSEILVQDKWVPFDPLNGYYAYLPANYLEVYKGDRFMVKRSADMLFDYNYEIQPIEENITFLGKFNLFHISGKTGISSKVLSMLMLLPLGALIVAIFRNVIGVKTFGVFLPVLIAISFTSTGLIFGIISFISVLLLISLLHYPLLQWGILHVPKLVVMLSGVVFLMVILLFAGMNFKIAMVSGLTFFPIIILTICAEKYARIVVEEGITNASKILLQTILVTLFCYTIVNSHLIFLLLMNFPEILLLVAVSSLMLGKWIGLRIAEYRRFGWVIS